MSISDTCQLLGRSLVLWSLKKQNSVALSIVEAEYISAGSSCAQLLWMKATLNDFGIKFKNVSLFCDNESAIKMTQNPVQHLRTKHIDIRRPVHLNLSARISQPFSSVFLSQQISISISISHSAVLL
jgi:hypothetical protein